MRANKFKKKTTRFYRHDYNIENHFSEAWKGRTARASRRLFLFERLSSSLRVHQRNYAIVADDRRLLPLEVQREVHASEVHPRVQPSKCTRSGGARYYTRPLFCEGGIASHFEKRGHSSSFSFPFSLPPLPRRGRAESAPA